MTRPPHKRHVVVVGESRALVAQLLLAIHCHGAARCTVISGKKSGFLRWSTLYSRHIDAEFHGGGDARVIAAINHLACIDSDLIVVAADCGAIRMLNRIAAQLRARCLPAPDDAMLDCLDNKWQFYQFCIRHGLTVPPSRWVASKATLDFAATVQALGLPFVIKPLDQAVSIGVKRIDSEVQWQNDVLHNPAYQFAPLIAQRYIAGADVGLNLAAVHGRITALSIQRKIDSTVQFFPQAHFEQMAHTLAQKSAYHGVMNIDARIEDGTGLVYLFEANPRYWRSLAASVWCGLNFFSENMAAGAPAVTATFTASASASSVVTRLTHGHADVYYHPLLRPTLWRVLPERGHAGRMARLMLADPYFFISSMRPMLMTFWQIANRRLFNRRINRVY